MNSLTRRNKPSIGRTALITFMIAFSVLQIFPMIWLLDFSLCKSGDLFVSGILHIPDAFQFKNYAVAWTSGNIPQYFLNSVIVTFSSVIITVILSLTLGYAFTRMTWKLSGFVKNIILLGMMIPIEATLLPNYLVFTKLGLTDSYLGLILPYVAFQLPIGVFIVSGFLKTFPKALEEAALIDGCGIYGIIFKIVLPLVKPVLVTIAVITFIADWNEFIMMQTYLTGDTLKTLQYAVFRFSGQYASNYAVQYAVMMIISIPSLIIYLLFSEQISKGIMLGAIKG